MDKTSLSIDYFHVDRYNPEKAMRQSFTFYLCLLFFLWGKCMRKGFVKKMAMLVCCGITLMAVSFAVLGCSGGDSGKLKMVVYYADNATLPFRENWLTVQTIAEKYNIQIEWEVIPSDYQARVSVALNTGIGAPDVILYQSITGENISLAMNGAIVPISDYSEWTPNWNSWVEKFDLYDEIEGQKLLDGKRYSLPSVFDEAFYDGGLLLREDVVEAYGFAPPKTFEDLYAILKAYKNDNPSSYPITVLAAPWVHYRMTHPSWGISVHRNGADGSRVLSWDYGKEEFFAGATSEQYREYLRFWNRLFAEGLLDPEMVYPIDNDVWMRKMATGAAIASYAYYDQIGGVAAASSIPGFKLQMYPPLEGPAGAHHQQKNRTGNGILFPIGTSKRADFEKIVRTIDEMFFSPEAARIWTLGVEGETYTMVGDEIKFSDSILESADGVLKVMQLRYGAGTAPAQLVWIKELEMLKYPADYAQINMHVSQMQDAIQYIPPSPLFNNIDAEKATTLIGPLFDTLVVWDDAFITGTKNLNTDWNAYVAEMNSKGIQELLSMYNNNVHRGGR